MVVVGLDGGGTRTRGIALTDAGCIHGWTVGGTGNYQMIGREGLVRLVPSMFERMDVDPGSVPVSLTLALAGAGREREQREIVQLVQEHGWAVRVSVVTDARAALEGAHGGQAGLIVIAGTGSIVMGKQANGTEARAGGWGPMLGDEGSGYWLGLDGLRAVFRARDGWGRNTALTQSLQEDLDLDHWDDLVGMLYSGSMNRDRIASLAPHVLEAATRDEVAADIVEYHGNILGRQVVAVVRSLSMDGMVPVACAGGLFRGPDAIWPVVARETARSGVYVSRRQPLLPPAMGAALLAWRQLGRPVDASLVKPLMQACPELP